MNTQTQPRQGRILPIFLLILLVLAACAPSTEPVSDSPATPVEAKIEETTAETEDTAVDEPATRTITDAMGREVTIPVDPQRIVTLSEIDTDSLLALGIIPVGAPNGRGQTSLPTYLQPMLDGHTTALGFIGEPNLETMLTLEPDLIIYSDPYGALAERIPELEQIAPVVVPYVDTGDWHWKDVFTAVAETLDKSAEAEAWLADYDEHTAVLGAQLPDDMRQVSIVRWMADGPRILLSNAFASQVLGDIGFERPQYQLDLAGTHPVHTDVISMEQIELIDADLIFAGGLNPEGDAVMQEAIANPLVQTLSAVQADRLFVVDGLAWSSTGGPIAAQEVLNDVEDALAGSSPTATDQDSTTTDAAESPFPVTIEHLFGTTVIESAPERVVSIGYNDHDALIAVGVIPVAVRYWFGDTESAIFPWAEEAAAGADPIVMEMPFGELNYEQILSLNPDLIMGVYSGITEEEYELLSEIAPVVAQSGDYAPFGMPWQEATTWMACAVGQEATAEALVAGVEEKYAQAIADHPEFAGKSVVVAVKRADAGYAFFSAQDPRTRYFTDLGFVLPAELDELTGESFYLDISAEQVALLDRDLIVFSQASYLEDGAQSILDDPLLGRLEAVQEGRFVILSEELDGAFSFGSVLSLGYVTEELVPQIADALAE